MIFSLVIYDLPLFINIRLKIQTKNVDTKPKKQIEWDGQDYSNVTSECRITRSKARNLQLDVTTKCKLNEYVSGKISVGHSIEKVTVSTITNWVFQMKFS